MTIRKNLDYHPGMPVRWRGPVPMSPDVDAAAAKPDANQATAEAAKKAEADRAAAAAQQAAAAAKAEADRVAQAAATEAAKKAEADRLEAAKKIAASPDDIAKKLADIDRAIEERAKVFDAKATALENRYEAARQKAVISTLRKMGADPKKIIDADLLVLAPKVDPDDPAGLAALEKWRNERSGLFVRADVGPQESVATYKAKLDSNKDLTPAQRERRERMLNRAGGGQ